MVDVSKYSSHSDNSTTVVVKLLLTCCTVVLSVVTCVDVWFREVRFVHGKRMKNYSVKFLFLAVSYTHLTIPTKRIV